jgi:hypothetical protein
MQSRYVCSHKMLYCSRSCGWMQSTLPFFYTSTLHCFLHHYVCYIQARLVECLQRELALHFTVCLLTNSFSDVNTIDMWWCTLLNKTCNLERLVENVQLHSLIIPKNFQSHIQLSLTCTLSVTFPTHNCHMTENSEIKPQECYQWQLSFHYRLQILSWNILEANNKKGNCHLLISQRCSCRHLCNTATGIVTFAV